MSGIAWSGLGLNLAATAAAILLVMAGVVLNVARGRAVSTIDAVWGAGFAVVAVLGLLLSAGHGDPTSRWLVTVLTAIWGIRLAVHVWWRNRGTGEDRRYEELITRHAGGRVRVAAFWVCLPQAAVLWFVSLPVQAAQYVTVEPSWWWLAAGTVIWAVGFTFEAVGDAQLSRFKADPHRRGGVLATGLWRYTRHPNYFGDACVWWGLYACACTTWPGAATIVSPVLMTMLLARGTGKPMTEQHLSSRPGYADYVRRTSGFFPLPPKRVMSG